MRAALLVFVGALSSIADGLEDCLNIDSFTWPHHRQGQCRPSKHPGAFYAEGYQEWKCWDPDEDIAKGGDADAIAKAKGFAGACTFAAYKSTTTPEDVPLCSDFLDHNPLDCHPGPERYWGACVTNISDKVKCIHRDDPEEVAGVAKGDCKFFSIDNGLSRPSKYGSVCRFEFDRPFKCSTVPTYIAEDKSTCSSPSVEGQELHPFGSACFSLAQGTGWSCQAEAAEELRSCSWKYLTGTKAFLKQFFSEGRFYDGLCLFPGSPGYAQAADWPGTQLGRVWIFLFVLLIFAAAGAGLLYWKRAKGVRRFPFLGGDSGAGSEMNTPRHFAKNRTPQGTRIVFNPADKLGLELEKGESGRVIQVYAGSQADRAGVKAGWVILKVGRSDVADEKFSKEKLRFLMTNNIWYHLIFKEPSFWQ